MECAAAELDRRHCVKYLAGRKGQPAVARFFELAMIGVLLVPILCAQETSDELRNLARSPVADAIKVSFGESINLGAGPYDRISNSLLVQPVIPWHISKSWLLVPRIVATAVAYEPDVGRMHGGTTGLGDLTATFFFTPFDAGKWIWGVEPTLLIPTATNSTLGKATEFAVHTDLSEGRQAP